MSDVKKCMPRGEEYDFIVWRGAGTEIPEHVAKFVTKVIDPVKDLDDYGIDCDPKDALWLSDGENELTRVKPGDVLYWVAQDGWLPDTYPLDLFNERYVTIEIKDEPVV
jgi:hypothetical protein